MENSDPSPDDVESTVPGPEAPADTPAQADTLSPWDDAWPNGDDIMADTPTPGPEDTLDDWRSAIPRDNMRRYIAREMSTWTDERRQAHEDEIRRIQAYRQQRGPVPSGPATGIPRAEVFAAIGAVMERLGKIWPSGLDTDPAWQDAVNAAAQSGDRETFLATVQEWETSETRRVDQNPPHQPYRGGI